MAKVSQEDERSYQLQKFLDSLQQGDVFLDVEIPIAYFSNANFPLSAAALEFGALAPNQSGAANLVTEEVSGLVVLSQTCDVIKGTHNSPLIQCARVVKEEPNIVSNVKRGNHARYVFLPALESQCLLADLDFGVYMEKPMLLLIDKKPKIRALRTDDEITFFSRAVSRKFNRFAFPDHFNDALTPIGKLIEKHANRSNDLGNVLKTVTEIRVFMEQGSQWDGDAPNPTLIFFFNNETHITSKVREKLGELIKNFSPTGKFINAPNLRFETYDNVSADVYRRSNPLDLSYLSKSK